MVSTQSESRNDKFNSETYVFRRCSGDLFAFLSHFFVLSIKNINLNDPDRETIAAVAIPPRSLFAVPEFALSSASVEFRAIYVRPPMDYSDGRYFTFDNAFFFIFFFLHTLLNLRR